MITEPTDGALAEVLRHAVRQHTMNLRGRAAEPTLHAGVPGGRQVAFAVTAALRRTESDHALLVDVVEALVRSLGGHEPNTIVWLTRRGQDEEVGDLRWAAAVRTAATELERPLPFVVVTRVGWRDPLTGVGRRWARVRASVRPPPSPTPR
ncbi:hypothetical protein [Nocardioides sp. R-C-SC26]|uniref:hypothetical protein n=1 Tax=Nocardioides sp. R-C-SC26 TaxID=2870414 RepID=UPI001E2DB0F6|nr:hypothetical protein [Nocardioides sp. R-C-SC26]